MFSSPKPVSFEEQKGALEAVPPADLPSYDQAPFSPLPKFVAFHLSLHQPRWPMVQPQTHVWLKNVYILDTKEGHFNGVSHKK